jgi:heme-degrading monooxygenase HmoA
VSTHNFHLAQMNIGRVRGPLNDPIMADFVAQLDSINALAEASPGFVWRLQGDGGESSSYLRAYPDPLLLVNLTVWESPEALHAYTYRSDHAAVFRRRKEWFKPSERPTAVLWWLPAGQLPSIEDGKTRLEHLWAHGPTPFAFTFRQQFPQPG